MTDIAELGQAAIDGIKPADEDLRLWSVTTIIGALDKPALVYWSAEETAKAAVHQQKVWRALADENPDDAVEWLKNARFKRPPGQRSAAELGSAVHAACEEYALTGIRPDVDEEVEPFLNQFDEWLAKFQPSYQATEVTVYSPTYGYAGTCDGFLTIEGVPLIIDYKTSRKSVDGKGNPTGPYPEVALQLSAYRYAEMAAVWRPRRMEKFRRRYYLLSPAEQAAAVPVPEVEGGAVIHITPQHCDMYPVRCDRSVYEAFLFVQEAARWSFQTSKDVIGAPMQPVRRGTPEPPMHPALAEN